MRRGRSLLRSLMRPNEKKGNYGLVLLATFFITYLLENFLRSAPSALSPVLIVELGITHGMAGLLISSCSFLYALMQVPSGLLSEALGPKKTIIGFTVFTVVGAILFYLAHRLDLLILAQLLVGLGSSVFFINAVNILSGWFPPERRATAIGVFSAASGLGIFVAYMGFPLASSYLGNWRILYLYCSVLMVVNFGANFLILKDSVQSGVRNVGSDRTSLWNSLKSTLGDRRIYPYLVGYILLSINWVFISWLPQFLTETRGLSYIDIGLVSSIGSLTGIPGCILVGVISDRLHRRKLLLIVFSASSTILLAIFLTLPATSPPAIFAVISAILGFTFSIWVLFFSMIPEIMPPETTGISLGLINGAGMLAYSLMTPVYGILVDVTGSYNLSNTIILVSGVLTTLIFTFFIKETYGCKGEL